MVVLGLAFTSRSVLPLAQQQQLACLLVISLSASTPHTHHTHHTLVGVLVLVLVPVLVLVLVPVPALPSVPERQFRIVC